MILNIAKMMRNTVGLRSNLISFYKFIERNAKDMPHRRNDTERFLAYLFTELFLAYLFTEFFLAYSFTEFFLAYLFTELFLAYLFTELFLAYLFTFAAP
jgi:hypothetical protein